MLGNAQNIRKTIYIATTDANAFVNGGNAFGDIATIGTTDGNVVRLIADNTISATFGWSSVDLLGGINTFYDTGEVYLSNQNVYFDPTGAASFNNNSVLIGNDGSNLFLTNAFINNDGSCGFGNYLFITNDGSLSIDTTNIILYRSGEAQFANGQLIINSNGQLKLNGNTDKTLYFVNNTSAPAVPIIDGWLNIVVNGVAKKIPYYNT